MDHRPNPRLAPLDGLRGIAVSMVLVFHCFYLIPGGPFSTAVHAVADWMWLGVDLFFVLSGYLITGVLLAARDRPGYFSGFYRRRIARIWPAFFLVLAYVVLAYPAATGQPQARLLSPALPWAMTLLQNWRQGLHTVYETWGIPHFWSLAVEEQFYLVWPLVVLLLPRRGLLLVCALIFIGSIGARALAIRLSHHTLTFYELTPCRLDGFAAGAAVAAWTAIEHGTWNRAVSGLEKLGWILLAAALLYGPRLGDDFRWAWSLGISGCSLTVAGVVARAKLRRLPLAATRLLCSRPLTWMGHHSYGIYLIHYVLLTQLRATIIAHLPASITRHGNLQICSIGLIVVALSLIWAWAMFRFVEAPALRWGHASTRALRPAGDLQT